MSRRSGLGREHDQADIVFSMFAVPLFDDDVLWWLGRDGAALSIGRQ
jgi:hypothetical protein